MNLMVAKIDELAPEIWELRLAGDFPYHTVIAGQFIMVRVGLGTEHVLRRPISIAAVKADSLTIIFRVVGMGTKWLSERSVGDKIDVLGPLGTGFPLPETDARVLIVGGGIGTPPLYQLAANVSQLTKNVDIVLGYRSKTEFFWHHQFAQVGNLNIATEDGSAGVKGYVTHALTALNANGSKWDYVYGCGPLPMLRAVKHYFSGSAVKGYVSLEEKMACGVGACYGCVCQGTDHSLTKRICKEGPVFAWDEVII